MVGAPLVIGVAFAYLLLLFAVATYGDRRAAQGRSVIGNAWVYTLSLAVYCTAWTYYGSVGRAASGGVWFLPIYLGPTLAMILAWMLLRKMVRIAKRQRITSIADFIAARYGKSTALGGLVTRDRRGRRGALHRAAAQGGVDRPIALMTSARRRRQPRPPRPGGADSTLYVALALAGFTILFGTRHLDATEHHEGMVAAIAFESLVKLLAFLAVGVFVVWGLFDGLGDLFDAGPSGAGAGTAADARPGQGASPTRSGSR